MFSIEVDRHDYKRAVKNGRAVFHKSLTDFWEVRIFETWWNDKLRFDTDTLEMLNAQPLENERRVAKRFADIIWNYPANCKIPIQMVVPGGWNVANGELVRIWCENVPPEYYNNNPFAFALLVENIKGDL